MPGLGAQRDCEEITEVCNLLSGSFQFHTRFQWKCIIVFKLQRIVGNYYTTSMCRNVKGLRAFEYMSFTITGVAISHVEFVSQVIGLRIQTINTS
jgi:hypothetical protein